MKIPNKKAAIIGAGIAGIATAIRLAHQGFNVSVFEASHVPGGKIKEFEQNGFRFDAGPSLLTLPSLIDELFVLCGKNPEDYIRYQKLDIICNYFFPDRTTVSAFADKEAFARELLLKTGEPSSHVLNYLKNSRELYELTEPVFLQHSLHRLGTYFSINAWKAFFKLYKLDSSISLHRRNELSFKSEKVIQLFDRYATYNGSDPFLAPATLKVIPHLEYNTGAYFPEGGMYQVIRSLVKLAEETGVKFFYSSKVEKLKVKASSQRKNGQIEGIMVKGKEHVFDVVVSNMDVYNTYRKLLPGQEHPEKILLQESSSSALVFYWGIRKQFPSLHLHNIFFSSDYKTEFDFITNRKQVYHDPTVYVNISSKIKKDDVPAGEENWFTMINVPNNTGLDSSGRIQDWDIIIHECRKNILEKLSSMLGENIEPLIVAESVLDPRRIEAETFSHLGALYGSSSNNRFAAFLRHKNFSSRFKNLYFCGGSVHPGGGIPLCLLSAKIVAELVQKRNA